MSLQDKIKDRMDLLQDMMEDNFHIDSPDIVEEHIRTVSKFWSVLSDEDRDYIHGSRHAIEEKMEWKI
jgi:hypothetical protein